MPTIPNYPKKKGPRNIYVKYPIRIDESIEKYYSEFKYNNKPYYVQGKYIAVNVFQNGYQYPFAPALYDSEEACLKACEIHNNYHGWTNEEWESIVQISMNNSIVSTED